jgi:outer membrane protease
MIAPRINRTSRWVSALVVLAIAPVSMVWAEQQESPPGPRVELSLRSWLYTNGETKWSHNASGIDPRLGNPTSQLTYKDNNTHIIELAARVNFAHRWFANGDLGFSVALNQGQLVDNDYTAVGGQQLFSQTNSNVTGSGTQYVNLDIGYRAVEFPGSRGHLDVFGGVQYWRTEYEATGVQQVVCAPSGIPGITCNPNTNIQGVLAITNTTHWITPLHVGFDSEYRITRRVSVDLKASVSPASIVYNEDIHHLRTDLQQNPSFSMWGVGVSANADASLKVMLTKQIALTGGYRIWWNRTYTGTWENHPVGAASDSVPLTELQTYRHGATLGLTAYF